MHKTCSLSLALHEDQPCPRDACAFWQPSSGDVEPGCAIERLELDQLGPDIADFLLGIRPRLERPESIQGRTAW